jgi:hypothetical protein
MKSFAYSNQQILITVFIFFSLLTGPVCASKYDIVHRDTASTPKQLEIPWQAGIAYPSWLQGEYSDEKSSLALDQAVGANVEWVAIVPTWYQADASSMHIFRTENTATDRDVLRAIRDAKARNLNVLLMPHVDALNGDWRGQFQPERPIVWFMSYLRMILRYAQIAERTGIDAFAVGTEFVELTRPEFTSSWRAVIQRVRQIYSGPMTYAANWSDEYNRIEFWDTLDFIGVDAYFELTNSLNPTVEQLIAAWQPWVAELEQTYSRWGIPIVFTEIGYRSIDGANMQPWDWSSTGALDMQEQADCYEAAFRVFFDKPWFSGMYWWHWVPDPSAGGPSDDGYTPQNKTAETVLSAWYN